MLLASGLLLRTASTGSATAPPSTMAIASCSLDYEKKSLQHAGCHKPLNAAAACVLQQRRNSAG